MNNIFNSNLELDCFCLDFAEAWIKYRQKINKSVTLDDFMEWVTEEFEPKLEINFADVYESEFGYREEEVE